MSLIFAKTRRGGGPCMFSTAMQQFYGLDRVLQLTAQPNPPTETGIPKVNERRPADVMGLTAGHGSAKGLS